MLYKIWGWDPGTGIRKKTYSGFVTLRKTNKKANISDLPQMLLKRSFPVSVLAWSGSAFMLLSKEM